MPQHLLVTMDNEEMVCYIFEIHCNVKLTLLPEYSQKSKSHSCKKNIFTISGACRNAHTTPYAIALCLNNAILYASINM